MQALFFAGRLNERARRGWRQWHDVVGRRISHEEPHGSIQALDQYWKFSVLASCLICFLGHSN